MGACAAQDCQVHASVLVCTAPEWAGAIRRSHRERARVSRMNCTSCCTVPAWLRPTFSSVVRLAPNMPGFLPPNTQLKSPDWCWSIPAIRIRTSLRARRGRQAGCRDWCVRNMPAQVGELYSISYHTAPEFPPSTANPPVNSTPGSLVVEMGNATSIRSTGERSADPAIDIAQKLDTDSFPSAHPDWFKSTLDNVCIPGHWGTRLSA